MIGRVNGSHVAKVAPALIAAAIKAGATLATWDPLTRPIITEYSGVVRFENVEEGVTVAKQVDEVTGLSTLVVIDGKRRSAASKGVRPMIRLYDASYRRIIGRTPFEAALRRLPSITTNVDKPVTSSTCLATVTPSSTFSKRTTPEYSVMIGRVNGSHVAKVAPALIAAPSFSANVAP